MYFLEARYDTGVPASIITSCGGEAQFGVCDRLTVNSYQIELEQEVLDRAVVHLQGEGRANSVLPSCFCPAGSSEALNAITDPASSQSIHLLMCCSPSTLPSRESA